MIYLMIVLVAISIVTKEPVFAWIALAIAVLALLSTPRGRSAGYFSPFTGGTIHVDPIWYHCDDHGNFPVHHVGAPTACPECHIQMKKGKKV